MKDVFLVIRGRLDWAKVVGPARPYKGNPKYDKGPNWSLDITPDEKSRQLLKQNDVEEKLREPKAADTRTESFLTLKVLENRADGTKNDPPKITSVSGEAWGNKLLGNGTIADVKVKVKDYGSGSEKGIYLQAIRILSHIPYESKEFESLSEDDEYFSLPEDAFAAGEDDGGAAPVKNEAKEEDLDDDIPF